MNLKFRIGLGILLALFHLQTWAQREPLYSQYMYNIGSFNAAYVGTVEAPDVSFLVRTQWMGFPGYNKTYRFGANLPLGNEKNGVGINIVSDKIGPTSQTLLDFAYSFQIQVSEEARLSFGLEAGGTFLNTDFSQGTFENPGEPILNSQIVKSVYPTLGAGLFLYESDWYLGLSVPNILEIEKYNIFCCEIKYAQLKLKFWNAFVFPFINSFSLGL